MKAPRQEFNDAGRLSAILSDVVATARDAGNIIMGYYGQEAEDLGIEIKEDNSPVTRADEASSEHIVSRLKKITPGISVISEENDEKPNDNHIYWVVDPLDGTREFLGKTGGFSVKIALIIDEHPVLGVVYSPVQGAMYYSIKGGAAYKETGGMVTTLTSRSLSQKGSLTALFDKTHGDSAIYEEQRVKLKKCGVLSLPENPDTVPGLPRDMQLAEGLADLHVKTGKDRTLKCSAGYPWDIAADQIILENAGGAMVRMTDGKIVYFPAPRDQTPAYIAFGDKNEARRFVQSFPS